MKPIPLQPRPSQLLESLRSIGYSVEAAIADLIDNSITAQATKIDIRFQPGLPSDLAVIDNGLGMDSDELMEAMRHGSRNPVERRSENDLGRFGLGLKTASLSQCRCLTVVSKRKAVLTACRWDLDYVSECNEWLVLQLESNELRELPFLDELQTLDSGTMVLWSKLDRLTAGEKGDGVVVSSRLEATRKHLSLVFHRFLADGGVRPLSISINRTAVVPVDPFLSNKKSVLKTPPETFEVDGVPIQVAGFTLPHISKLRPDEIEVAGGSEGLRRQQGFYVYRNKRLIIWGTWFKLMRQEELTKLTRVRVDIPNSLDHLWTLDIKKATANPPEQIRDKLKVLIPKFCGSSREVQEFRARRQTGRDIKPIWLREELRSGEVRYCIDREQVVVDSFLGELDDVSRRNALQLFRAVEESFPGEAFYNDRAMDRIGFVASDGPDDNARAHLEDLARQLVAATSHDPSFQITLLASLSKVEPFSRYPEAAEQIAERIRHEHGLG